MGNIYRAIKGEAAEIPVGGVFSASVYFENNVFDSVKRSLKYGSPTTAIYSFRHLPRSFSDLPPFSGAI